MAEFRGKLAIFWQKRPRFAKPRGGGGSPENLKTQGGLFWKFSISGGGIFAIPPPLLTPDQYDCLAISNKILIEFNLNSFY